MGQVTATEAEYRLMGEIAGGFVTRRAPAGDQFLVIKLFHTFLHLKLEDRAGKISVDGNTLFPNLAALVQFYKRNPIPGTDNIRLR